MRPTGQPVIVLSDRCQEGSRDSCPGPGELEHLNQLGSSVWGLIESRWVVLELSFEGKGKRGVGRRAFWAGNNIQMKARRRGLIME